MKIQRLTKVVKFKRTDQNRQVLMDRLTKQELGSQPNTEKRALQIQNQWTN
jgi:hypothetical protein